MNPTRMMVNSPASICNGRRHDHAESTEDHEQPLEESPALKGTPLRKRVRLRLVGNAFSAEGRSL
jgi:hypothetical protein